jgi:hypothetical protein
MAVDVVERMLESYEFFFKDRQFQKLEEIAAFRRTSQHLQFQRQMFKGLAMRADAIEKRLQNEINLV